MSKIEPMPMKALVEWIRNTYGYRGIILILSDGEDAISFAVDGLDQLEAQDALATGIHYNRLFNGEEEE